MEIDRIVSRDEAMQLRERTDLYNANEWLVGREGTGTRLNLHRQLAPELTRELRFIKNHLEAPLVFKTAGMLDEQNLRSVRELSSQSAALLNKVIEATDTLPYGIDPITVSRELMSQMSIVREAFRPEEISASSPYQEGAVKQIFVNRYERDSGARSACIRHYGNACQVCGADLESRYGKEACGLIHVHHLIPLATLGVGYEVDPIADLCPVCPNCHAVIHRREPPYSINEVKDLIRASEKST